MLSLLAPVFFSALIGAAPAPSPVTDPQPGIQQVAKERAGAMVTIRFSLKMDEGEQESEAPGVMIEKDGLVLGSNRNLGGFAPFGPNVTPTEIKVLVGDDTQGVEATLIARDSELGLAWVKIKEPKGDYAFVDFEDGAQAGMGDPLYVVSLLGKFFDRAPSLTIGTVSAVTTKPRKLIIPSLSLATTEFGVPVFGTSGKPVGVTTLVLPEEDEIKNEPGGLQEIFKGVPGGKMILPAAEVVSATKNAKATAAAAPKEEPKADAPKADEKPAEPKTDAPAPK